MRNTMVFFDEEMDRPKDYIEPEHNPLANIMVLPSTGFALSERHLFMHWLTSRAPSNWDSKPWKEVKSLYRYWPNLKDIVGSYAPELPDGTRAIMTYMVTVSSGSFITPVGVLLTDRSPGVVLLRNLETIGRGKYGMTRNNISLVPLETEYISETRYGDMLYWWWKVLRDFDWGNDETSFNTLVYWTDYYNRFFVERVRASRTKINKTRSARKKTLTFMTRKVYKSKTNNPSKGRIAKVHLSSKLEGPASPSLNLLLHNRGILDSKQHYADPLLNPELLGCIRDDMGGDLPESVTIHDISDFFRTGTYIEAIGDDASTHHKLNAILCTYPNDIQNRLSEGLLVPLDPRQNPGEIIYASRKYTRRGEQFLTYEKLRQLWPQPRSYPRPAP